MLQALLTKSMLPLLIGGILGTSATIGLQKLTQQQIKISCPEPKVSVSCPPPKIEGNGIEIEKLKGLKGKFTIEQHYHIEGKSDSLLIKRLMIELDQKLQTLRIAKCK